MAKGDYNKWALLDDWGKAKRALFNAIPVVLEGGPFDGEIVSHAGGVWIEMVESTDRYGGMFRHHRYDFRPELRDDHLLAVWNEEASTEPPIRKLNT